MKKLQVPGEMVKRVGESFYAVLKSMETGEDIRKTLTLLPEITTKLRSVAGIYETPENIFVSYLLWDQFRYIRDFEGHDDEWYTLNEEAIEKLRSLMKVFFKGLKDSYEKKDMEKIIETVIEWWPKFIKMYKTATRPK